MDLLNNIINTYNLPILTAFLLGIMTSISPCPLATNITAIAFISRKFKDAKQVVVHGLMYIIGRAITYISIAVIVYMGFSAVNIQGFFQLWGDKLLGPFLIITGIFLLDLIKLNYKVGSRYVERIQSWIEGKGYLGSMCLGAFFALAFCPYSGVMFFGLLIPLIVSTNNPLLAPVVFSIGTGLPVLLFSFVIALSVNRLSQVFNSINNFEIWFRKIVGIIFVLVGLYYLQYLVIYILNL